MDSIYTYEVETEVFMALQSLANLAQHPMPLYPRQAYLVDTDDPALAAIIERLGGKMITACVVPEAKLGSREQLAELWYERLKLGDRLKNRYSQKVFVVVLLDGLLAIDEEPVPYIPGVDLLVNTVEPYAWMARHGSW